MADRETVSWDAGYTRDKSLTTVACSDGANGLIWRYGWNTLGDIPNFPYVGGAEAVRGWNSPAVSLHALFVPRRCFRRQKW